MIPAGVAQTPGWHERCICELATHPNPEECMRRSLFVALVSLCLGVPGSAAQVSADDPWLRAVGAWFDVPASELGILSQWPVQAEEIPVVLFISDRAGASRDALLALRRARRSWGEIGERFGLVAGDYHVVLGSTPSDGALGDAYAKFASSGRGAWASIVLEDAEIVALVNLRFLAGHTRVDETRVAQVLSRTGSARRALVELAPGD